MDQGAKGSGHWVTGISDRVRTNLGSELERCLAAGLEGIWMWVGRKLGDRLKELRQ